MGVQFVAAHNPFAFARYLRGKISLTYTQAVGPLFRQIEFLGKYQVGANVATKR
jgi:hypothetical protein